MKFFVYVFIGIVLLLFSVSVLLPTKQKRHFNDEELRKAALSRNMSSTPSTYEELLKLVDSEQNRLTKAKINLGKDLYFDKILSKNKDISCATCHVISKNQKDKNIYLDALTSKKTIKQTVLFVIFQTKVELTGLKWLLELKEEKIHFI